MRYILKIDDAGIHSVTDEDLDELVDGLEAVDESLKGKTLREAIRVDVNDTLGWKKAGYHTKAIEHKLLWKYESEAINEQ